MIHQDHYNMHRCMGHSRIGFQVSELFVNPNWLVRLCMSTIINHACQHPRDANDVQGLQFITIPSQSPQIINSWDKCGLRARRIQPKVKLIFTSINVSLDKIFYYDVIITICCLDQTSKYIQIKLHLNNVSIRLDKIIFL